jgi:hypothetical protein
MIVPADPDALAIRKLREATSAGPADIAGAVATRAFWAACREGVPALFAREAELERALEDCLGYVGGNAEDRRVGVRCRAILAKGQR